MKLRKLFGSGVANPQKWLTDFIWGGDAAVSSGVRVNTASAMTYPPVWYALSKISGHVGLLPLNLYRRGFNGQRLPNGNGNVIGRGRVVENFDFAVYRAADKKNGPTTIHH